LTVVLEQWFSKWAESPSWGAILRGKETKKTNKGVIEGVKMLDHYSMIELSSVA